MDIGVHMHHKVHEPFLVNSAPIDALVSKVESVVLQDFPEVRERRK